MKKIFFVFVVFAFAFSSHAKDLKHESQTKSEEGNPLSSSLSKKKGRPNIIFLFADDQREDAIGASGNPYISTPNLDKLASEGCYFRNNYCAGSYTGAVCVASRAMLMTGMHWTHMKSEGGMNNCTFFPELLADKGYQTFITGKWHNKSETLKRAFQSGKSVFLGGMNKHTEVQVCDLTTDDQLVNERMESTSFSTELFANEAINYINNASQKDPFFLYVAFSSPHDPRNPSEEYRNMYYENRPPLPENFRTLHPFDNGFLQGRDESLAPWPRPRAMISDQLCEYYGLVTYLDKQVGRILDALKNSPFADNTYVIYTADQGLALGSHGLMGKQNVYEQSMKSPLIVWGPGVPHGKRISSFTYIFDLYATCCNVANVDIPEGVDSKDLSPIWNDEKPSVRESVFLPFQGLMRTVNDGRWKLHIYPPRNYTLLFDLESDPNETTNLATDPYYKDTIERLTNLMKDWQGKVGDKQPLSVEDPLPVEVDYHSGRFSEENRILDVWQPQWIIDKYWEKGKSHIQKVPGHEKK
ncbi:sulfatase-like hydrolase/transferase [Sunxiuqinia sp. A32]|uniref:sulfatase-like hydrolase/transferase n=1 Tax=Sunxiuqinia sp. A32 TaxID=3461496 RepID=UPI0040456498